MKKILFTFLFLLVSLPSFAATYYINSSTGNDSNPGTIGSPFASAAPIAVKNFLNPGDTVHIASGTTYTGNNCTMTINSSGVFGAPINIIGDGTTPIFNCAENVTSIAGWTGWTNTSGNVYESNIVVPFTVQGVIVDGTYNLLYRPSSFATHVSNLYYQSGGNLFVNLTGGSADFNPADHTIEVVGQYGAGGTSGIIQTGGLNGGNYVTFTNLETYGAISSGVLSINKNDNWNSITELFSGYASIYCATHSEPPGCYYNVFTNNTSEYSNGGATQGSNGENVVVEGSYNDYIGGTIAYGGMAGYDVIDYASDTPAQYNRLINSTVEYNSVRQLQNYDNQGFDPQVYCDGCSYFQAIGNVILGNGTNANYSYSSQNRSSAISLSTEHPATAIPHDVYIFNNYVNLSNFTSIATAVLNGSQTPWYNVWIINNTFNGSTTIDGGFLASFSKFDSSHGVSLHVYNNIFAQSGVTGGTSFPTGGVVDANNNDYYGGTSPISYNSTNYSVSGWNGVSGQDASSINSNPFFINASSPYDFHLQRVSLGQSNTSPCIGTASANYYQTYLTLTNNGTTRSDAAQDTADTDMGYHYSIGFGSSLNWLQAQIGSDIN